MLKVIYIKKKYPEIRNIINIIQDIDVIYKEKNITKTFKYLFVRLIYKILKISNWNIDGIYKDYNKKEETIIHTFNTICITQNQWCVSFESIIPRIGLTIERIWEKKELLDEKSIEKIQKLCDFMLENNCKRIIAISQSAYKLQKEMLDILKIEGREKLMEKTIVLYPPQKLLSSNEEIDQKNSNLEKVKFIFIANGFFLKGGKEVIDALIELKKTYKYNIHLTIVSNFSYVEGYETKKKLKIYEKKISSLNWIKIYKNITNEQVLELCKKSHIGLLPSYQETFGYSVLEMQASGTPVITTNVRAFPELNNSKCGWIINLHIDKYGETKNLSNVLKEENKKIVYNNLIEYIHEIFKNKNIIRKKAYLSIKRIKENHDVVKYSENIKKIYKESIKNV